MYNTKLYTGDVILADRGFTCGEYASMALAEVKTPPFTRGKKQLEEKEVDWSRELSLVRIHVELVIGMLKQNFTINFYKAHYQLHLSPATEIVTYQNSRSMLCIRFILRASGLYNSVSG